MEDIIIGTEAVAAGIVTRYELQRWYRPIFRNVHAPRNRMITLRDRIVAAWLFSRRRAIVTGLAASAMHGSSWVDRDIDIELIYKFPRAPRGILARDDRIDPDEYSEIEGLPVATPARAAFDLGRIQRHGALARLDALMQASPYSVHDVMRLAERYKGARGVAMLKDVLPLVDSGSQSPMESWWRKLVVDAGFPKPRTQVPVADEFGHHVRFLDLGWEDFHVALEYDGDQHQSDRAQYLKDRWVIPELHRLRWAVIGVVKEDDPVHVLGELHEAMVTRGWRGVVQIPRYAYSAAQRRANRFTPNLPPGRGSAS